MIVTGASAGASASATAGATTGAPSAPTSATATASATAVSQAVASGDAQVQPSHISRLTLPLSLQHLLDRDVLPVVEGFSHTNGAKRGGPPLLLLHIASVSDRTSATATASARAVVNAVPSGNAQVRNLDKSVAVAWCCRTPQICM